MNHLSAFIGLLSIALLAFIVKFSYPDLYEKYNVSILIFLTTIYSLFYLVDFILKNNLSPEKHAGKDLVFIVLKFLILLFYVTIRTYRLDASDNINTTHNKITFLLHFLIYAIFFMIVDTIINYNLIKNNTNGQ